MIQSGVTVIKQPPYLSPELADRGIDLSLKGMNIQKIIIGIVTGIDILFRLSHNSSYRSDITQDKKQKGEVEVNRRAESVQCAVCSVRWECGYSLAALVIGRLDTSAFFESNKIKINSEEIRQRYALVVSISISNYNIYKYITRKMGLCTRCVCVRVFVYTALIIIIVIIVIVALSQPHIILSAPVIVNIKINFTWIDS